MFAARIYIEQIATVFIIAALWGAAQWTVGALAYADLGRRPVRRLPDNALLRRVGRQQASRTLFLSIC